MFIGDLVIFNVDIADPGMGKAPGPDVVFCLLDLIGADLFLGGIHRLGGGDGIVLRQKTGQIAGGEGKGVVAGVVGQNLLHHLAG